MPFRYERDDDARRVIVRFTGVLEQADVLAVLARHSTEDIGKYGVLYDLRELKGHPTIEDMRVFISGNPSDPPTWRPHGPIAFVATDSVTYKMACTCAARRPPPIIEVFRDPLDAVAWLARRATQE